MDAGSPNATNRAEIADRSTWPVVKGRLSELEREEADLSATTTVAERFAIMWQLAQDAWAFRGEPIGEPELSRHIVRVIRRRS
jgi:hypothetical protein